MRPMALVRALRTEASRLSAALRRWPAAVDSAGPEDVFHERKALLEAIEGRTLCHQLRDTAERYGAEPALTARRGDGQWETMTWAQLREQALVVGAGLASLGVRRRDVVAIMATNRPEHIVAIWGVVHAAATPSTLYGTLTPPQIQYAADNCAARVAILDSRELLDRWLAVRGRLPALERIVLMGVTTEGLDPAALGGLELLSWDELLQRGRGAAGQAFAMRWQEVQPEDPVTLIYTSGTTGTPKGVPLSHENALWTTHSLGLFLDRQVGLRPETIDRRRGATLVSYLPLAHIAEQMISIHLATYAAAEAYCCPEITEVLDVVRRARPIGFFAVPRLWEKIRAGIAAKGAENPSPLKRRMGRAAVEAGLELVRRQQRGEPVPLSLRLRHLLADRVVLRTIREALGLDRALFCACSAAPLPVGVAEFFAAIGLPLAESWGMTETVGLATFSPPRGPRIGAVGRPLPGVEVALAEDGELLVRGPNCVAGYHNLPAETDALIDDEGWVHSGDIGRRDADGFFRVVDRKKELLITSSGKNISPVLIENYLKEHPLISQALAYGDGKHYLVALMTLDPDAVPAWAAAHGLDPDMSLQELSRRPEVLDAVGQGVQAANARLSRIEQVKKFHLLPVEWPIGGEELTPTMKLKRRVIHHKYRQQLEALYAE